jgi:hypothetical protein
MVNGRLRSAASGETDGFRYGKIDVGRYFKFYENSPLIRSEYGQNREHGFQACLLACFTAGKEKPPAGI